MLKDNHCNQLDQNVSIEEIKLASLLPVMRCEKNVNSERDLLVFLFLFGDKRQVSLADVAEYLIP